MQCIFILIHKEMADLIRNAFFVRKLLNLHLLQCIFFLIHKEMADLIRNAFFVRKNQNAYYFYLPCFINEILN